MNQIVRIMTVAVLAASAVLVGGVAQAYPDPVGPTIVLDPDACAGDPLPFSASASISGTWTVEYDGRTATGSGDSVAGTFTTVAADAGVSKRLTATVDDGTQTLSASTNVVLEKCGATPPVDPPDGSLPGTGSDLSTWLVLLGLAFVMIGTGLVMLGRRRRSSRRRQYVY